MRSCCARCAPGSQSLFSARRCSAALGSSADLPVGRLEPTQLQRSERQVSGYQACPSRPSAGISGPPGGPERAVFMGED